MSQNILIMNVVFIVVVPDICIAFAYQNFSDTVFPECIGLRMGEIQVAGKAAPEGKSGRRAVLIMQEPAVGSYLFI